LAAPDVAERFRQQRRDVPRLARPGPARQGQRLSPQFRRLVEAFDSQRAQLSDGVVDEIDPELVVVFDLAGTVENFRNAVNRIEGLEFLTEYLDEDSDPDDDFYMESRGDGRIDARVRRSLYLVMSNTQAINELISLFNRWQLNQNMEFEHGLAKFRYVFDQLRSIRRWGPADRIRDTGLLDDWRERLALIGQSFSPVLVEIELWYRRDARLRDVGETKIREIIRAAGGQVSNSAHIGQIAYHALLAQLPAQQVEAVVRDGAEAIELLDANEIMFVNPYTPMTVSTPPIDLQRTNLSQRGPASGLPRVALLDGLPFVNHDLLTGRLSVDDPDDLGQNYAVASRHHGTAMASLIIHGDLSNGTQEMERPLYVRPIMRPHEFFPDTERVVDNRLFTDLLHRAIRRIVVGEDGREPVAPSIRIINLSIGAESRAFVRRISPVGRLIDWLAADYNLLFVVSAGNHRLPLVIPATAANDARTAKIEALKAARGSSRLRGILPPGDALNALTVGAAHADGLGDVMLPDTVWDILDDDLPALYGAVGPGVGRSIKPEVYHSGGRAVYVRPVIDSDTETVILEPAQSAQNGPGTKVAAPARGGVTNAVAFTHGTSNAAALVTREANWLFDILEAGPGQADDFPFPDPLFHPVLAKALLVHASSWGDRGRAIQQALDLDAQHARRDLTALLGYGNLDLGRVGKGAASRAVLISAGLIAREQRHTYHVPLPVSLRAKADWHRFTVTLAYMAPTVGYLMKYRGAKVFFEKLDNGVTGGTRIEAEHRAVRRGSCQQEIIDGDQALTFADDGSLPIHVQCMDDAQRLKAGRTVRYGLVVSVETSIATSATIHDEIRVRLQAQAREQARARLRS
jgi:hypothetical protein